MRNLLTHSGRSFKVEFRPQGQIFADLYCFTNEAASVAEAKAAIEALIGTEVVYEYAWENHGRDGAFFYVKPSADNVTRVLVVAKDDYLRAKLGSTAESVFPKNAHVHYVNGYTAAADCLKSDNYACAFVGQIERVSSLIPGSLGSLESFLARLGVPTVTFLPAAKRTEVLRAWALKLVPRFKEEFERRVPLGECSKEQVEQVLADMYPKIDACLEEVPMPEGRLAILDAGDFDLERVRRLVPK